jgi:hypothetical protein
LANFWEVHTYPFIFSAVPPVLNFDTKIRIEDNFMFN